MPILTNHKVFEYKICYHVALRADAILYETKYFTLIGLLLKLVNPALIYFNIQIKELLKIIFSIFLIISILSLACACPMLNRNIVTFFLVDSNLIADLLMLMYLIIEACRKLQCTKNWEDIAQ